uniref:Uncharacterized protein n=1 Tax=Gorilla gorilla gorilla TaxID=9595 RepID=A0A2I2Z3P9_GORGO
MVSCERRASKSVGQILLWDFGYTCRYSVPGIRVDSGTEILSCNLPALYTGDIDLCIHHCSYFQKSFCGNVCMSIL